MTAKITRADLLAKLEAAGVPGGPINTLEDVFADPQVLARKLRIDLPSKFAKGGSIPGVRSPITINGVRMAADTRAADARRAHRRRCCGRSGRRDLCRRDGTARCLYKKRRVNFGFGVLL